MIITDTTQKSGLVLVVEDETSIADILVAYLQRDGLRTRHADNGHTALQLFRQARPDIVLLDIRLPGVDGVDILKTIRAESDTPVIMVTAMADDIDKLVSLRMGADTPGQARNRSHRAFGIGV